MNRYLITELDGALLCGLWDDRGPVTLDLFPGDLLSGRDTGADDPAGLRLGDIRIAKVKRILREQQSAFCDVLPGVSCYLPLDRGSVLYTDGRRSEKDCGDLKEGHEILVQVAKEAHGRKLPVLNGFFDLPEYDDPRGKVREIMETARTRTCYSLIYRPPSEIVRQLLALNAEELEMIRTDLPDAAAALEKDEFLKQAGLSGRVSLYSDDYPMGKLYSVRTSLDAALDRSMRLRSGTELVIEHTEAFWTVDVNTGRRGSAPRHADKEETVLQTNIEAAAELARQMRLRNMSGIAVIDFINMTRPESRSAVEDALKTACAGDPAGVQFGGFTKFGLYELRRKRTRPALYEQAAALRRKNITET